MKWFKHMTASGRDEKLSALREAMGNEGIGLYWTLLEIVAEQMDESDKCSSAYSLQQWSSMLGSHHHKVTSFFKAVHNLDLAVILHDGYFGVTSALPLGYFTVTTPSKPEVTYALPVSYFAVTTPSNYQVIIPNLLKYRDSYSKNLQAKGKGKLQVKSAPTYKQEVEVEVEVEELKTLSSSADEVVKKVEVEGVDFIFTSKNKKLKDKRLATFLEFWDAFGYKSGKAQAAESWINIPSMTDSLVGQIILAAKGEAERRPGLKASGGSPKMAQGWLTAKRWNDEEGVSNGSGTQGSAAATGRAKGGAGGTLASITSSSNTGFGDHSDKW